MDRYSLSLNPNSIHILKKLDKVHWYRLSRNPSIFTYHYKKMIEENKEFCKELVGYIFNPIRVQRLSEKLDLDLDEYLDLYE